MAGSVQKNGEGVFDWVMGTVKKKLGGDRASAYARGRLKRASVVEGLRTQCGLMHKARGTGARQFWLAQLVAEKNSPVADVAYYGVTFGIQAKKEGVTSPYKPANWNDIPAGLKDPDGHWFTIH